MAVIDRPEVLDRLTTMLLDPEVRVGLKLPFEYEDLIMSIRWSSFLEAYGIELVYLYTKEEPLSQEMVDAFSIELGWAEASGKPVEEDIWL